MTEKKKHLALGRRPSSRKAIIQEGMSGRELALWRSQQPGSYVRGRRTMQGWPQHKAAKWYGCSERQGQRYEGGVSPVPVPMVRRIRSYHVTLESTLDAIFDTSEAKLNEHGSPFPELSHEFATPSTGQ